jgi:hypothetical protein
MNMPERKVRETRKPLNDIAIKNAKPRDKLWRLLDGDPTYRGLRLEIFPDGAKRWAFRFSFNGVDCTEGLGVYPVTGGYFVKLSNSSIIFANYWLSTHHTGTYPDSYCPKNLVVLVQKQSVSKTIQIKQSKNGMAS